MKTRSLLGLLAVIVTACAAGTPLPRQSLDAPGELTAAEKRELAAWLRSKFGG
jgi:hypothetical protein